MSTAVDRLGADAAMVDGGGCGGDVEASAAGSSVIGAPASIVLAVESTTLDRDGVRLPLRGLAPCMLARDLDVPALDAGEEAAVEGRAGLEDGGDMNSDTTPDGELRA